jgi:uncharacterized damage-inducible protein DinB
VADRQVGEKILQAWRTNHRVTTYLVERLPSAIWNEPVPGVPRQTVRMVAAHIHNSRCRWVKSFAHAGTLHVPRLVDLRRVTRRELVRALGLSGRGIEGVIRLGIVGGGELPRATWQNFPPDLLHFLTYFVAHEAHHRGQLILVARQLGYRLPPAVSTGVWQWNQRSRESR